MKVTRLSKEEQDAILAPEPEPHEQYPQEVILARIEAEWLIAHKDGRKEDMARHDREHAAVLAAKDDRDAHAAFEAERGVPFISKPTPPPEPQ